MVKKARVRILSCCIAAFMSCTILLPAQVAVASGNTSIALMSDTVDCAVNPVAAFVTRFYNLCLSRDADPTGLSDWMNRLSNKTASGADVGYGFVFSKEFLAGNVSNEDFVRILYRAFFDREADSTGYQTWKNLLDGGASRYFVLSGFTNSAEFQNFCDRYQITRGTLAPGETDILDRNLPIAQFVARFYSLCLGRTPDTAGWIDWVSRLVNGQSSGAEVSYGFIFSPEFLARNLSNSDYVTFLYRVFFGREPDSTGLTNWVNLLNSGKQRIHVLDGFLRSQEFLNIASKYGINVGTLTLPPDVPVGYNAEYARAVFDAVNVERKNAGVAPLVWDSTFETYAITRAAEISVSFSHTRPDGTPWYTIGYYVRGENIAMGYTDPASVMYGWMHSTGHKENILRLSFTKLAVACYEKNGVLYWEQLFG